jgi:hypothetical protein
MGIVQSAEGFHDKNLVLLGNFIIFLASLVCEVFYQPLKSLTVVTDF